MTETPWLQNLACYWAQILIVVLAGAFVRHLLQLTQPRVVLIYWQVLLGICLGLPLLQQWKPVESVDISVGPVVTALVAGTFIEQSESAWFSGLSNSSLVLSIVLAGIFVRLGWVAAGLLRLSALKRRAVPLSASGLPLRGPRGDRQNRASILTQ